jgi:hypothetical protein
MGGRVRSPEGETILLDDSAEAVQLVQQEIFASGLLYMKIAELAGVSTSTVGFIAQGQTKWPRLETMIRILGALGWDILATKRSRKAMN